MAVTRAKALLIVVGNPEVLILDPMWRALIKFIIENGGYLGKPSESELDLLIRAADDIHEQENVQAAREARGEYCSTNSCNIVLYFTRYYIILCNNAFYCSNILLSICSHYWMFLCHRVFSNMPI